jgi:hypothetical protein
LAASLRTGKLDLGGDEQQIEDDELSYAIKAAHISELFDLAVERDLDCA